MVQASITGFIENHDGWALLIMFALITFESFGLPLPGETALIACGVLASQGTFDIAAVIAVAAFAAILGDNLGFITARKGGRALLERHRVTQRYVVPHLARSERFFQRHGGKAVFFGRFIAVLRVTAAWTAGLSGMNWWRFLFWNASGGIVWATAVGLVSYYLGEEAGKAIGKYGVIAAAVIIALLVAFIVVVKYRERRAER